MINILRKLPFLYLLYGFIVLLYLSSEFVRNRLHTVIDTLCKKKGIIWILAGIAFLLSILQVSSGHGWGDDFAQYIAQARAIVQGTIPEWVKDNAFIINHSEIGMGSDVYPWGFPLMLVPLYRLFGLNFIVFKVLQACCIAGAVVAVGVFLQRHLNRTETVVLLLLVALNPAYLNGADDVTAHLPSFFLCTAAVLVIDYYLKKRSFKRACLTGLLIGCAYETRTINGALLIALFIVDLRYLISILKKPKEVNLKQEIWIGITPYVMFLLIYGLVSFALPKSGETYSQIFVFTLNMLLENMQNYFHVFGLYFCNYIRLFNSHEFLFGCITVLFLGCCLVGMGRKIKEELFLVLYLIISVIVLLFYNGIQGAKYVYPLFPYLVYFAYIGFRAICKKEVIKKAGIGLYAGIIGLLFLLDVYSVYNVRSHKNPLDVVYTPASMELYDYIEQNVSEEAVLYFFKPRALYLNTDRRGFQSLQEENLSLADYILITGADYDKEEILLYVKSKGMKVLFQNDMYELYGK